ncbi:uncharacterized protein N7483_010162 [Penicillium malachiteum]|uniref:uncharacterized protein n=1 Tax=Penicillium malachiteum TaxID=1324776 RepID=UPI002548A694|nr:uncharacterized protein N7483_010162 [Penicillium malachiteum]KAJ5712981.1 hypothetical protein N7483_010162 [Penicillium malachiteum]
MSINSTSSNMLRRALSNARVPSSISKSIRPAVFGPCRNVSSAARLPTLTASETRRRPTVRPYQQPVASANVTGPSSTSKRTIFIQTENTPNPDLFDVEGVTSVFYGADFITVTKSGDVNWAHIKPEVFSLITQAVTSGETIVSVVEGAEGDHEVEEDSLAYNEDDDEVVSMIKELLETRIRPAIQEDGGDIELRGFEDGIVMLKLRGACRTCDSSTVTLKNGIESMLMHYIEEVKGVEQVMDQEEIISMHEFAKFEEQLRKKKGEGKGAAGSSSSAPSAPSTPSAP